MLTSSDCDTGKLGESPNILPVVLVKAEDDLCPAARKAMGNLLQHRAHLYAFT